MKNANRDQLVAPVRALIADRDDFRKGIVEVHDALSAAGVNSALASGVTELAGMRDAQRRRAEAAEKARDAWVETAAEARDKYEANLAEMRECWQAAERRFGEADAEAAALRTALALIDGVANRELKRLASHVRASADRIAGGGSDRRGAGGRSKAMSIWGTLVYGTTEDGFTIAIQQHSMADYVQLEISGHGMHFELELTPAILRDMAKVDWGRVAEEVEKANKELDEAAAAAEGAKP